MNTKGGKSWIKDLGKKKNNYWMLRKKNVSELKTMQFSQQHSEVRTEKQTEKSLKGVVYF